MVRRCFFQLVSIEINMLISTFLSTPTSSFWTHGAGQFEFASCQFSSDIIAVTVLPSSASSTLTKQSNSEVLPLSMSGHSFQDVQRCRLRLNTPVQWPDGVFSNSSPLRPTCLISTFLSDDPDTWTGTGYKHSMGVIMGTRRTFGMDVGW